MLPSVPCKTCGEPFLFAGKLEEAVCAPCGGKTYYSEVPADAVREDESHIVPAESCAR